MGRPLSFDRDQVLDKAMHLYWRQGYRGTSVDDLEEHLGIRRASLYNAFGGKRRLFLAVVDRYVNCEVAKHLAVLDQPGSAVEAIRAFFQSVVRFSIGKGRGAGCLLTNSVAELANGDEVIAGELRRRLGQLENRFYDVLCRAQVAGELRPSSDPRALAHFLMTSLHGLRVMSRVATNRRRMMDVVDLTLAAVQ